MCFWWYKMASFLELSPGNRKSCECLKKQKALEKPDSGSSFSDPHLSAHQHKLHRPRPHLLRVVA